MLRNDEIQEAIAREQDRLSERTRITRERIMKELSRSGFADMRNFAEWSGEGVRFRDSEELSPDDSPAVKEVSSERRIITSKDGDVIGETVTLTVKLHDKKGALELMGKHLGMWTDNLNIGSGDDPVVIRIGGGGENDGGSSSE
jgi:phage terminase small subunit